MPAADFNSARPRELPQGQYLHRRVPDRSEFTVDRLAAQGFQVMLDCDADVWEIPASATKAEMG